MLDEPIHPELEAKLQQNPHDWKTWKEYAEWLVERGEPRGELMRSVHFSLAERRRHIIEEQWASWFGELSPAAVECTWSDGFVRELRLKPAVPLQLTGRVLFTRRSLAFLQTLKIGTGSVWLFGLEMLRVLRRVEMSASLSDELAAHRPPNLRELQISAPLTEVSAERLSAIEWLRKLDRLELGVLGATDVLALLPHARPLRALAGRLVLRIVEDAIVEHRSALREALPEAWLATHVDPRRHHCERLSPSASNEPRYSRKSADVLRAEARASPPVVTKDSPGYRRCGACAGEDVFWVFHKYETSYSEKKCESYHWSINEFVCRECGRFTSYERYWES